MLLNYDILICLCFSGVKDSLLIQEHMTLSMLMAYLACIRTSKLRHLFIM